MEWARPEADSGRRDLTGSRIGRYSVRARVGAGGMGEVYLADDTRLKRVVALKRLAPRLQSDPHYRRHFLKEAERASQLSHHHIAGIYDVLEERGETFLVMEYVEGRTLRHAMRSPLGVDRARTVARQAAEALAEAHRKGIVHLDIKPENIMLTPQGEVKVLDFGLAMRLHVTAADAPTVSMDSMESVGGGGTPGYTAPEVLLRRQADRRADIFSLGVVLYEMLARRHPFAGPTVAAINDRILHETPLPLGRLDPEVPADLERTVARMLAKDPSERHLSADDVVGDLGGARPGPAVAGRRIVRRAATALAAAATITVIALGVPSVRRAAERWLALTGMVATPSIAVLPFTALDGDPETKAYAAGLSEALTASLTRLTRDHDLQVAPMREVKTRKVTTPEKARDELGATLVIGGELRRAGGRTRLDLTLVDSLRHTVLRTGTIVAAGTAPFDLEDRQLIEIAAMLALDLPEWEQRHGGGTSVAAAHDLYLQGIGFLQDYERKENIDRAIALFQRALGLDPRYALVHAGLGQAYRQKYRQTKDGPWMEQATASCQDAVRLDAQMPAAHVCLGEVLEGRGDYEGGVAAFRRAAELEPTSDAAFRGLATAYEKLGRTSEAEATYRKAIDLRPRYWAGYSWLGAFYINRARYADAQRMFEQVVTLVPENHRGYSNLGASYLHQGRYQDAVAVFERANAIAPSHQASSNLGTAYYYTRRFPEMVRTYRAAIDLGDKNYNVWGNLGEALYWDPAGKREAPEVLRRAVDLISEELEINPRQGQRFAERAKFEAMLGDRARAREDLDQALALGSPDAAWTAYVAAIVENQLGRTDQALDWIDHALAAGYTRAFIRDDPAFDNLRRDARFREMLRRKEPNAS